LESCRLQNFRTRDVRLAGNGNLEKRRGGGDEPDHVVEVVVIPKAEDPRGIRGVGIRQRRQREQQRARRRSGSFPHQELLMGPLDTPLAFRCQLTGAAYGIANDG